MGVLVDNPRYERLAQCLAAGMRQSDIARELDYTDKTVSEVKNLPIISKRVEELLASHAEKSLNTGAIADLNERKRALTRIIRTDPARLTPTSPGHVIAAAKEINLMERVYQENQSSNPVVSINVILPDSHNLVSAHQPTTNVIDASPQPDTKLLTTQGEPDLADSGASGEGKEATPPTSAGGGAGE